MTLSSAKTLVELQPHLLLKNKIKNTSVFSFLPILLTKHTIMVPILTECYTAVNSTTLSQLLFVNHTVRGIQDISRTQLFKVGLS